jgi:hypothetical protein
MTGPTRPHHTAGHLHTMIFDGESREPGTKYTSCGLEGKGGE